MFCRFSLGLVSGYLGHSAAGAIAQFRRLGKIRAGFPERFAQFRQPNLCDGSSWLSAARGNCGFRVFALSSFRDYIPGRTTKTRRSEIAKDSAGQPPGTSAISGGDSRVGLLHRIAKHRRCGHGGRRLPHAVLYTNVHITATAKIEPAATQPAAVAVPTPQWWTYLHSRALITTGSGGSRADHNRLCDPLPAVGARSSPSVLRVFALQGVLLADRIGKKSERFTPREQCPNARFCTRAMLLEVSSRPHR